MNDSRNTGTLLNITVVLDSSLFVLHSSLKLWMNLNIREINLLCIIKAMLLQRG